MSITLRIALFLVSLLTCGWVLWHIRKSRVKIEDSVFWLLFSAFLLIISIFPQIVSWGAKITGVMSPSNFIFLAVIFILIVKVFRMSIRISQLESKLQRLAQAIAIREKDGEDDLAETQMQEPVGK